jgi:hypothetical protein
MPSREVLVATLRRDGMAFAVVHNHPSGKPSPSNEDIGPTLQLQRAAKATGIQFLGHVVVTDISWRIGPAYRGTLSLTERDRLMRMVALEAAAAHPHPASRKTDR